MGLLSNNISFLILLVTLTGASCSASLAADVSLGETKVKKQGSARQAAVYDGWAAIKRDHFDAEADEKDWIFIQDLKLSDDGDIVKLIDEGNETGYSIQLIVITYERTNTTVLKLGLVEDATEKTITYIWSEPGAQRLGMNLRWLQVGLTRSLPPSNSN